MVVKTPVVTKDCVFCGGRILDNRPHRIRSIRSDVKYCGPRCRFEAFMTMHLERGRAGGKHRPKVPRQPELEKRGAIADRTYWSWPPLRGFDEGREA